jgi:UDP-N-acetylglucosamine--N-acetylmuramyl-(pentapeptide) pyrophosphoryl-undecaprenol N-acetylglucosamine transferase
MPTNQKTLTIVLASGGTGGHIFPAESLAAELIKQNHKVVLITDTRYKKHDSTPSELIIENINSGGSKGGIKSKLLSIIKICFGILESRKILQTLQPDVVVGFGGYPSLPTMIAAITLKLKTIIHEQNSVLGRVNKMLTPYVGVIATAFEEVKFIKSRDAHKVKLTGNPVRPAIRAMKDFPYPGLKKNENLHLLITGGSQGATVFSEVVPAAILSLPEEIRTRLRIDQQCRAADIENVKKIYSEANVNVDLATFFEDMPSRLAAAHLIIARSGASTIAEITVIGKPAILIPYMHAMDDHQTANAMAIQKNGAALVIPQERFTPEILAASIKGFIENPESLKEMAVNALALGKEDAVEKLAEIVLETV